MDRKILFIQIGDFKEAFERFGSGEPETYRDQRASVEYVTGLSKEADVTVIGQSDVDYTSGLAPNLTAMGADIRRARTQSFSTLFDLIEPTHIVLRIPLIPALKVAASRKTSILPNYADLFRKGGVRNRLQNWQHARILTKIHAPCLSNHSLNASKTLNTVLGVPEQKIVPWDWSKVPVRSTPKNGVNDKSLVRLFYAGSMIESKGIGDLLAAIAILRERGQSSAIAFAGSGDLEHWKARARELGIEDHVEFKGRISNEEVRSHMASHDIVIVPSRHSYPEGLPNTIYEGLASRTPLIISDHPAFVGRLEDRKECLFFKAGDPSDLAKSIDRLVQDSGLYSRISAASEHAHDNLYIGLGWSELITNFVTDETNQTRWVEKYCLSNYL